ncbi:PAS domain-containing protein [Nisaea acidiphila]|uniref:PAS domain-containing protein n=1 Tax=Nisaea acidiphila TaxID=1862145 RepID=A0A9J7B0F8_9PROT|nr:PAS domain-containing protein [Nisaea acidiphila]UUX51173.1 PAS domain-containing protein [Nisaea acidiphila]
MFKSEFRVAAEIRDALLQDRVPDVNAVFLANDAHPPKLAWAPDAAQVEDGRLRQLLAYWQTKRTDGPAAPLGGIDPAEMRFILGYLMILEALEDGADFRYRLYGSLIAERFGRDVTGQTVCAFGDSEYIVNFFLATYQAVVERAAPLLTTHFPRPGSQTASWTRLILPLSDEGGRVARLLVGQIPGAWRPRPPGTEPPPV